MSESPNQPGEYDAGIPRSQTLSGNAILEAGASARRRLQAPILSPPGLRRGTRKVSL